jgi:transposase
MSQPRKSILYNVELSGKLNIEELEAIEGDSYNITAVNADREMPRCIRCEGEVRNHGRFEKEYTDVIKIDDGSLRFISLHYVFYKYRCTNCECHTLFQKPINFARENANVTKRFEDHIVNLAMFLSYSDVEKRIRGAVSKQAVGQIVKRWTISKDEERGTFQTPQILGLVSFILDSKSYILAVDAGDKEIRIIDVLPSVSADYIITLLKSMNVTEIKCVLTDCEPVIVDTIKDQLPNAEVLVDTDALLKVALEEFNDIIRTDAAHVSNVEKEFLRKNPAEFITGKEEEHERYEVRRIKEITNSKPRISDAYDHINLLRAILSRDWDATEIFDWNMKIPDSCKDKFIITSANIEAYWNELLKYYMRRNEISDELYDRLFTLNNRVKKFKFYSDEILRGRILYIPTIYKAEKETSEGEWRGVPLEIVIESMDYLIKQMEDWKYERQRSKD